jgi:hypothetical protein
MMLSVRFIGEGYDGERFEEIAREIGVTERVRFLGAVDQHVWSRPIGWPICS